MTDSIDLDDIETETEEEEDRPNRGDWFWRGEGDPDDEPSRPPAGGTDADASPTDAAADGPDPTGVPRVPRDGDDRPVGIPKEQGGGGSVPAGTEESAPADAGETPTGGTPDGADATGSPGVPTSGSDPETTDASAGETDAARATTGAAPHGESADDMTMALTYRAAKRLADPGAVFADAGAWADWVGIVGRVDTHVINKFQREHRVDADFFSGTGTGPGERLAEIDRTSMFYADRMVVVGVAGEDERVAAEADWEFVPLSEAAEKAGWDLKDA